MTLQLGSSPGTEATKTAGLRDSDRNDAFRKELLTDPRFAIVIPDENYADTDEFFAAEGRVVRALKAFGYNLVKCTPESYRSPDGTHMVIAGSYNSDGTASAYVPVVYAVIAGKETKVYGWWIGQDPGDKPDISVPPKSLAGLHSLLAVARQQKDISNAIAERHAQHQAKLDESIQKSKRAAELADYRDPEILESKFAKIESDQKALDAKVSEVLSILKGAE